MMVWMWRHAHALSGEMKGSLSRILARERAGSVAAGLFLFTFLMVFREGIETVLFLSALSLTTSGLMAVLGVLIGLAAAVAFGVFFVRGSLRIDLGRFFKITGIALGIFVLQLLFNGYHELSEAGWVPANETTMATIGPLVQERILLRRRGARPAAADAAGARARGARRRRRPRAPRRRLERAGSRRQSRARVLGATLGLIILAALGLGFVYSQPPAALSAATPVEAGADGKVRIPLSTFQGDGAPALPGDGRRPAGALHRRPDRARREGGTDRHRLRRLPALRPARLLPGRPQRHLPALRLGDLPAEHRPDRAAATRSRWPRRSRAGDLVLAASDLAAGAHLFTSGRTRARTAEPSRRMYARLLIESLRRGTRRKLLAVSAVALGTLGATALGEVVLASGDRLAAEMGSYGANLVTTPAREGETLPVADLAKVRQIFWRNNIVAVSPSLDLRVRMPGGAAWRRWSAPGSTTRWSRASGPACRGPGRPWPSTGAGRARRGSRRRCSAAGSPAGWGCGRGASCGRAWASGARASGWWGSSPAAARRTTRPSRRWRRSSGSRGLPGPLHPRRDLRPDRARDPQQAPAIRGG